MSKKKLFACIDSNQKHLLNDLITYSEFCYALHGNITNEIMRIQQNSTINKSRTLITLLETGEITLKDYCTKMNILCEIIKRINHDYCK